MMDGLLSIVQPDLFRLDREFQWIPAKPRRKMRLANPSLRLGFRQGLNIGVAVKMCAVHHLGGIGAGQQEDGHQNMDHKIYRRDLIVMDDDAV